ncbi:hypothetical protein [Solirubrobacter soli]|uniref:hypothetical protein n=1 Tax=Solirubrobacter soli TaxID=363832 RepID=UPI00041608E2|nr:hypothetical protein [Solirubrobacter soli]
MQLATSREAAFGHCLAPYRPRAGLDDDIDAYLDSEPEDGVVAHSGWVSSHIFDGFKLLELHFVRDAYFQRAAATHRFQRITHSHVVHQARIGARLLKVRAADPPIGHELRFLHWDYRVVWNHRTAVAMLEMYDDSHIRGSDWDLHRAAERLGITLT